MSRGKGLLRRALWASLALGLAVLLGACTGLYGGTPQAANSPAGSNAKSIWDLFVPIFWLSVVVFLIVFGVLITAVIRFRRKPGDPLPHPTHGNTKLEIVWTIIPALILAAIAVPTISTIANLAQTPKNPVIIKVVGQQWWWSFQYPDNGVTTADEMHIPVNRGIHLELVSRDVIHSFWVPKLAGKEDVVPGRTNVINFTAEKVGTYSGQCAEFCGEQHANMRFTVVVQTQADYNSWLAAQKAPPATPPAGSLAAKGRDLLLGLNGQQILPCVGCHTINGTKAEGSGPPDVVPPSRDDPSYRTVGPNLTHFGSRTGIAGDILSNTPANLFKWIHDTQAVKPGNDMPNFGGVLTSNQINAVVAYLESLK